MTIFIDQMSSGFGVLMTYPLERWFPSHLFVDLICRVGDYVVVEITTTDLRDEYSIKFQTMAKRKNKPGSWFYFDIEQPNDKNPRHPASTKFSTLQVRIGFPQSTWVLTNKCSLVHRSSFVSLVGLFLWGKIWPSSRCTTSWSTVRQLRCTLLSWS